MSDPNANIPSRDNDDEDDEFDMSNALDDEGMDNNNEPEPELEPVVDEPPASPAKPKRKKKAKGKAKASSSSASSSSSRASVQATAVRHRNRNRRHASLDLRFPTVKRAVRGYIGGVPHANKKGKRRLRAARVNDQVARLIADFLVGQLHHVVKRAACVASGAHRKTVTADDVVFAAPGRIYQVTQSAFHLGKRKSKAAPAPAAAQEVAAGSE